ncbi:DUF2746 domain-containing protein [Mycobacterium aquaticum]|nr:DUF2746 domain-containing protein [Mycobacterium aquaticum]
MIMMIIRPDAATVPELPELAHNPWELATWGIIGLVAVIAFWIWTEHRSTRSQIDKVGADVKAVKRQVNNDHPEEENLRDQLDRMEAAQKAERASREAAQKRTDEKLDELNRRQAEMRERQIDHGQDISGIRDDVGSLRGEDRQIKQEHTDLVRRLNAFIRREHPGADPL